MEHPAVAMEHLKRRRPNFSDEEVMALITAVSKRKNILLGKFDKTITAKAKLLQWQAVIDSVNCVSTVKRDVAEVRKKFYDLRTQVKKKATTENQYSGLTGGGPPVKVKYSHVEKAMLPLLSRTAMFGSELPENEADVSVGEEHPRDDNELCLEIMNLEGNFQVLPGAVALAEVIHSPDAGPSSNNVAANPKVKSCDSFSLETEVTPTVPQAWNQKKLRTLYPKEPVTSTPTKPVITTESFSARGRKRRSIDSNDHTMAHDMLSVQREILNNTGSMAASLTVIAAAVEKIANAFVSARREDRQKNMREHSKTPSEIEEVPTLQKNAPAVKAGAGHKHHTAGDGRQKQHSMPSYISEAVKIEPRDEQQSNCDSELSAVFIEVEKEEPFFLEEVNSATVADARAFQITALGLDPLSTEPVEAGASPSVPQAPPGNQELPATADVFTPCLAAPQTACSASTSLEVHNCGASAEEKATKKRKFDDVELEDGVTPNDDQTINYSKNSIEKILSVSTNKSIEVFLSNSKKKEQDSTPISATDELIERIRLYLAEQKEEPQHYLAVGCNSSSLVDTTYLANLRYSNKYQSWKLDIIPLVNYDQVYNKEMLHLMDQLQDVNINIRDALRYYDTSIKSMRFEQVIEHAKLRMKYFKLNDSNFQQYKSEQNSLKIANKQYCNFVKHIENV
ncbi:uncharacterized protein LOC108667106 [Hyalella azteca]|uniref:Regulatory protein zeste n=1 Tax=Hyalella azteca TaxID=294128 RepID=A0A8B7N8K7_HYAAZ|nr:uncharacterized protein LOC108667106 [Hyalella azteca]